MFELDRRVYSDAVSSLTAWLRWRWAQVTGRNPVVRRTDRIEAAGLVSAVLISVAMTVLGGTVGAHVYDVRAALYQADVASRHEVTATVVGTSAVRPRSTTLARATWHAGTVEHSATVVSAHPVKTGDRITIWVDRSRSKVVTPMESWEPAAGAAGVALELWLAGTAAAAALFLLLRRALRISRFHDWERGRSELRAPMA